MSWQTNGRDPLAPAAGSREFLLHWTKMRLETRISSAQLHQSNIEVSVGRDVDDLVLALTRALLTDRVLSRIERVPCQTTVNWSTTVAIELPRSWWRRLLRKPARLFWRDVSGTVTGTGMVDVMLDHLVTFPDPKIKYPHELGRPVRVSQLDVGGIPIFDGHRTDADDPYASEQDE